jgi:hypothetical protein
MIGPKVTNHKGERTKRSKNIECQKERQNESKQEMIEKKVSYFPDGSKKTSS